MINAKKGEVQTGQSSRGALWASTEYPPRYQSPDPQVDTHCLASNSPICVWQATIPPHLGSTAVHRKENTLRVDEDIGGGTFEAVLPYEASNCQAGR